MTGGGPKGPGQRGIPEIPEADGLSSSLVGPSLRQAGVHSPPADVLMAQVRLEQARVLGPRIRNKAGGSVKRGYLCLSALSVAGTTRENVASPPEPVSRAAVRATL